MGAFYRSDHHREGGGLGGASIRCGISRFVHMYGGVSLRPFTVIITRYDIKIVSLGKTQKKGSGLVYLRVGMF